MRWVIVECFPARAEMVGVMKADSAQWWESIDAEKGGFDVVYDYTVRLVPALSSERQTSSVRVESSFNDATRAENHSSSPRFRHRSVRPGLHAWHSSSPQPVA